MKPKISVVISAWNESARIEKTLKAVAGWADELVFIDSGSTDDTPTIARRFTDQVYKRPNHKMLNVNKNFGFSKATGDWILCLDADEQVTPELAVEIQKTTQEATDELVGYWISRKNIIFGKWIRHGLWWPDTQLRLFRRGRGRFPEQHVHEYIAVDGKTGVLQEPYIHQNYDSVSQFIRKMDEIYTESEVTNLRTAGYVFSWYDAIRFPVSDFLKIYFAQDGWRDGLHGLVLALLQSAYSLVVFAKLWENQGFPERQPSVAAIHLEFGARIRELFYWLLTVRMKTSANLLVRLFWKIRRRFFI